MALSQAEVAHLGELARISLSDAELEQLAGQLDVILQSVAEVSKVASADILPTSHALGLSNVFRADEVRDSLTMEQALSGAPSVEDERFRVPQILGEA